MSLPLVVPTVNACSGCGKCCKDFGSDGISTGLTLFPAEFRLYSELAKKRGLEFSWVPKVVAVQRGSANGVVSHYVVLTQPCVFYDDSVGCSIYAKRPLVCRAFPFSLSVADDLLVGNSTARKEFIEMASQLGEETPGILAARKQRLIRDKHQQRIQEGMRSQELTLQTTYYRETIDVDQL